MLEEKNESISGTFISDSPIGNPSNDLFKRWPFAQRIANAVVNRSDLSSIVIGINGEWGEGKTSVMNFINLEFSKQKNIVCVKFNPWRFGDENELIKNYFKVLANALDKSISTAGEKIGEYLSKYASYLAPLSISLPFISLSPGQITEFGKALPSSSLEDLRNRIQDILTQSKKRVVVLMDDIDRLDKSEIQAVFKLVKLSADFSNISYILAFDEKMVAAALHEKYSSAGIDAGQNFLEKIVQVPLHLPKADELLLRDLCFQGVDIALQDSQITLTENQVYEFINYFTEGFGYCLNTPRISKRYINALSFALPILKGETHPVDLMLIEGIRIFYPKLYKEIRENKEILIQNNWSINVNEKGEKVKQWIENVFKGKSQDEDKAIRSLLIYLFPLISGYLDKISYGLGRGEELQKDQRIASSMYFDRYFSYSVPKQDVSDIDIEKFLTTISNQSFNDVISSLQKLVNPKNAERVISKLRGTEKNLSENVSVKLSKAIASCGRVFPNPEIGIFSIRNAWSQAAVLIYFLLLNVPSKKRLKAAKAVISSAEPLPFAIECFGTMRPNENKPDTEHAVSKEAEKILGALIVRRTKEESKRSVIYLKYGKESRSIFQVWYGWSNNKEEISEYLYKTFKRDKYNIVKFLKIFLNSTWDGNTGIPRVGEFRREQYDSVSKFVNPEIIYKELKRIYGAKLKEAEDTDAYRDEEVEKKIAVQFVVIYHFQKKQSENNDPSEL